MDRTEVYRSPNLITMAFGEVYAFCITGSLAPDDLTSSMRAIKKYAKSQGAIYCMSISKARVTLPDLRARTVATELVKNPPENQRAAAVCIDGSGFWASAARSVATAILAPLSLPHPYRVFGEIDPALDWIGSMMDKPLDKAGLRLELLALRDEVRL
ncbi:MAG: hypothetical protein R3A47_05135 [Polyangiales bacterium]